MDLLVYGTDLSFLNVGHVFEKQGKSGQKQYYPHFWFKKFPTTQCGRGYANDYNITSNDIVINMFLDFVFLSITITIGMVIQITNTKSNNSTCFLILF